jgi:hypothetical protein
MHPGDGPLVGKSRRADKVSLASLDDFLEDEGTDVVIRYYSRQEADAPREQTKVIEEPAQAKTAASMPSRNAEREPVVVRTNRALVFVERCVPARVADEEIGDALEALAKLRNEGRSASFIYWTILVTIVVILVHGAQERIRAAWRPRGG